MSKLCHYTYEVVPTGWDGVKLDGLPFKPFLVDVPALDVNDEWHQRTARRAYFQAMAYLNGAAEPEEFEVYSWTESFGRDGKVDPSGLIKEA